MLSVFSQTHQADNSTLDPPVEKGAAGQEGGLAGLPAQGNMKNGEKERFSSDEHSEMRMCLHYLRPAGQEVL